MSLAPVLLSLRVATLAIVLAGTAALLLAGALANRRVPLRPLLDAVLTTPLILPPSVLGYYLLVLLGRHGPIGRAWLLVFDEPMVFSVTGAVVAASVTAFPLVFQAVRAAVESVDGTLIQAARTLGAGPWRTFFRVALPLASRGVVAGLVLGFARALGEFGMTLMVAGNIPGETQTASIAIYDALAAGRRGEAASLVLVMTLIAVGLMLVASAVARRPHAR